MKNIDEIKNLIEFSLESKKIKGFIENNCLYVNTPIGVSSNIIILTSFFFFAAFYWVICLIYDIKNDNILCYIPFVFIFLSVAITFLSKDYLVLDFNNKRLFKVPKLFKFTLIKSHLIDFRSILGIGIDMTYKPGNSHNFSFNDLFKKKTELEKFENICFPILVYLNSDGKLQRLSGFIINNDDLINLGHLCDLISEILEIPSKVCEKNQRIEIDKSTKPYSITVKTLEYNQEKKNYIKAGFKNYFINLSLHFLLLLISLEGFLIYQYGFFDSFKVLYKSIIYIFTVIIPKSLGLK